MLDFLINTGQDILFIVTVIVFTTYLTLVVYSAIALRKYLRKNSYVDYNSLITSPLLPSVSVIVPAYNERTSIVENIRTLLSLYYSDFEIVVINDGSSDDTLEKMIEAYELEKVNYFFDYKLSCERIRGVYKSRNRSYKRLMIIDKQNGGKSDALNAGLNVVQNDLFVSIDADSIMEQDALLRLVKPFLEAKEKKVIGAGGVIRIANSCEIQGGQIKKIHLPKKWLPRAQVMEYTRAFLLGRISWSELDGLLLISGALGMFDRETVIGAGGYSTKTVGEDMELVVRIRRYMADRDLPYSVEYIPDPLCWTEVPSTVNSLARQRSRWTRGTMETLYTHRKLFLNRKYGKLGMLGYPYWLFFEWLAPILEFLGILFFIFLAVIGRLNVSFFLLLLGFVYFFAVSLSIWTVLFEEISFHKYEKRRDLLKLVLTAFLEPLFYHPLTLILTIKGNIDKIRRKSSWGKQERKGFAETTGIKRRPTRSIVLTTGTAAAASVALVWFLLIRKPDVTMARESNAGKRTEIETVAFLPESSLTEIPARNGLPQSRYYLIAGSFKSRENALILTDHLKSLGYSPEIHASDTGNFRVSLYTCEVKQTADEWLVQIRKEPGLEDAWIWIVDE